jgi:metal-responsive CopG/Arc/MetJ family transcriptional regulator
MTRSKDKRFVISIPGHLAAQISAICETEGLSYPDFFCEAAQAYLDAKLRAQQYLVLIEEVDIIDDPFCIFSEWGSKADRVYDTLQ